MPSSSDTPSPEKRAIADVSSLFQDDAAAAPKEAAPTPRPPAAPSPAEQAPSSYELEEPLELPERSEPGQPFPATEKPAPASAARRPARDEDWEATPRTSSAAAAESVQQVWSRAAEWGPNIAVLALVAIALAFLVYQTFSVDDMTLGLFVLLAGLATLVLLSYPIVITLERPVRMTPEQAINDFYGSLAHHLPHYRRMWLLLSTAGRTSSSFASYEGFKAYWKLRLTQLRGPNVSKFTPLVFKIDDFKSEKSAGRTSIDVKFTVTVHARGRQQGPPLESIKVSAGLVRGPDQMWYLNKGTLPGERKERAAS